jgi:single-stranded-DNA-specific exonuclease
LTIREDQLPALRDAFAEAAFSDCDPQLWNGTVSVDAEIGLDEISWELHRSIRCLEPFGVGNPEPVFLCRGVHALGVRTLSKEGLRMTLSQGDAPRQEAVGFGLGVEPEDLDGPIDVLCSLQENTWAGRTSLQLFLKGIRPAAS